MCDKIFDKDVQKYLLEAGVSATQINAIKFNKAKQAGIDRIQDIISLIKEDRYEKVRGMLSRSPAGDCMGRDNSYLDFGDIINVTNEGDGVDLEDFCNYLESLKKDAEILF